MTGLWAGAVLGLRRRFAIVARSDTVVVCFGEGLAEVEVRYLHALLVRAVTGR